MATKNWGQAAVWTAVLALCLTLGVSAMADTVVLQNTAADQTIVDDTRLDKSGNQALRNFGGGGNDATNRDDLNFYGALSRADGRASVVRFNNLADALPAAVGADPTKITKVTLTLYQEAVGYPSATQADNVSFYRVLRAWDEGTLVFSNTGSPVDGATGQTRIPGVGNPAGWTRTGGTTNVWQLSVAETVAVVGYNTNVEGSLFTKMAAIAEVDAAAKRWWYDAGTLYVNRNDDPVNPPDTVGSGVCYYTQDQAWDAPLAGGDADIDKVNGVDVPTNSALGGWDVVNDPLQDNNKYVSVDSDMDADLLDWVRGWVSGAYANNGMVFAKGLLSGNEWNNRRFTPSDANGGASDYTYGPELTIEYVPEPATLALLALGSFGLATLHRRRK